MLMLKPKDYHTFVPANVYGTIYATRSSAAPVRLVVWGDVGKQSALIDVEDFRMLHVMSFGVGDDVR